MKGIERIILAVMLFVSLTLFGGRADAYAATVLMSEDMQSFEKLIFYSGTGKNMAYCNVSGVNTSTTDEYGFFGNHYCVPASGKVVARYTKVGQFKGRDISAQITLSGFEKKDPESFKTRDGRSVILPYTFLGSYFYDGNELVQKVEFYYTDDETRTPIDMTDAFLSFNGLNYMEYAGGLSGQDAYLSVDTQLRQKEVNGMMRYGNGVESWDNNVVKNGRKCTINGVHFYDKKSCPIFYVDSVLFRLKGDVNKFVIEDRNTAMGSGISWSLDLTTLHVQYSIITHVEHGTISPSVNGINYNESRTVEFAPDEGCELVSISVDGVPVDITGNPGKYLFSNITSDHEIYVKYAPPFKKVTTEIINGNITDSEDMIPYGSDRDIVYEPHAGYVVESITVDKEPVPQELHPKDYLFSNIVEDHDIKVVCQKIEAPEKQVLDKDGKDIDRTCVNVGDELVYRISYKNPVSRNAVVKITDTLPMEVDFISANQNGIFAGGKITWTVNASAGAEGSVTCKVRVSARAKGKTVANRAVVQIDDASSVTGTVENYVPSDPKKDVRKDGTSVDGGEVSDGETVEYVISVRNTTALPADIRIEDQLPLHMVMKEIKNGGTENSGLITWELPKVPAGESREVSFTATVKGEDKALLIENTADVTIGKVKSVTNKTVIRVPAVTRITVLGSRKEPVKVTPAPKTVSSAGVLGQRKVGTFDRSLTIVYILLALCAAAGMEAVYIRRKNER